VTAAATSAGGGVTGFGAGATVPDVQTTVSGVATTIPGHAAAAAVLHSGIPALGLTAGDELVARLCRYLALLHRWNRRMNLTAVRGMEKMARWHVLDSLSIHRHLRGRVLDVGSGAGLPGLPVALALPALAVTLLESRARRVEFLREAVRATGASNVHVLHARAEDRKTEKFDTLAVRAVGSVKAVLQSAGHLCAAHGSVVMMKGPRAANEVAAAANMRGWHLETVALAVPGLDRRRCAVIATRAKGGE